MQQPYIIVGPGTLRLVAQRTVERVREGYIPLGSPFREIPRRADAWHQAMYRAPEQDNRIGTDVARAARLALKIYGSAPGITIPTAVAVAWETVNPSEGAVGVDANPEPDYGTEGALRDGDLNPVPIAGDEPLPMTWEQECERLEKSYRQMKEERDQARAECERMRECSGMDKPEWAVDEEDVEGRIPENQIMRRRS